LGQPLAAIGLRVEGRPETSPSLLNLIDIKPGDKLSVEAFRRVAQKFDSATVRWCERELDEQPDSLVLISTPSQRPVNSVVVSDRTRPAQRPPTSGRIREEFNGVPALARTVDVEEARQAHAERSYLSAEARERRHPA
jgi:hypothetical protein